MTLSVIHKCKTAKKNYRCRDFQDEAVKGISEAVDLRETMTTPAPSNGHLPPSAASSDQLSMEFEIAAVDDDILNTVEKLFNFGKSGAIPYDTIQDILGRRLYCSLYLYWSPTGANCA